MTPRSAASPRVLLVEGDEDKRVIPELIEANRYTWEQRQGGRVAGHLVEIKPFDGIGNLDPATIKALAVYVHGLGGGK